MPEPMTPNQRLPRMIARGGIVLSLLFVWLGEPLVGMDWEIDELLPRLFRTVLAVLPFAILYLHARYLFTTGRKSVEAEVIGAAVLVTVGFLLIWSWYLLEMMQPSSGGANIGLGIIMIFSPLLLAMLIFPGRWLGRILARYTSTREQ